VSKTNWIQLGEGKHSIRLFYFEDGVGEMALELFVTPPGQAKRYWTSTL
jgi:hypothetical protein